MIPAANAAVEGVNSWSGIFRGDEETIQFRWTASLLAPIPTGVFIDGISFRLDAFHTSAFPVGAYAWSQFNMLMATRSTPLSTSSLTANEVGAVSVRSGPLNIPNGALSATGSPHPFSYFIDFTTPFFYPGGDLFLSIRHDGGSIPLPDGIVDFAQVGGGDLSQIMSGNSFTSTTVNQYIGGPGFGFGAAAVVNLRVSNTVVPEPSTVALLGVGLTLIGVAGTRRRRGASTPIRPAA